ncbi:MAG: ArnT family glycosyltransferase [Propionibacteriaceae bacterium]
MATFTAPTRADDRPSPVRHGDDSGTDTTPGRADVAGPCTRAGERPWIRRGSLALLLVGTAVLYLVGLSASGFANSFYAAAAQAGSQSWEAFFFGSLDAGNAITVDKPPFSLWLMALSIRIFGLGSWSLLVPQALLGVGTVGVMFASVRRTVGHGAGLLAGVVVALTPVATLMFRFDNPDAMLVLLLTLATYFVLRATEHASAKSMVVAGVLVGLAFLTKMLQGFLVLPVFALVYLLAAPTTVKKRILHLLAAFGAVIVAAGWWVAIVELVPASWRPYVGGSTDNSVLNLTLGYNGLGRIFGQSFGTGGSGSGAGASFGSEVGLTRMFAGVSGGMISWLIPAALLLGAAALVLLRKAPRTDLGRAAVIGWLGSLVITALTFSVMAGTYHDYYTVALAPGIAGTVAVAGTLLWRRRDQRLARVALTAALALTTAWSVALLGQATGVYADLRWVVAIAGALATVGFLFASRLAKPLAAAVVALAVAGGLTGPAAYALNTAATAHRGSIVTAGPVQGTGMGSRGGPIGGIHGPRPDGGMGGGGTADSALVTLLNADADSYTWVAATTGSATTATYQLATEHPVMAIGGFTGSDNAPTLDQFTADVSAGKIHYYLGSAEGGGGRGGGNSSAAAIASWVADNCTATTVGTTTVYDLTAAN